MNQEITPNISGETAAEWRRIGASWDPTRHLREHKAAPRQPKRTPGHPKESPRVIRGTPQGPHQSPARHHVAPRSPKETPGSTQTRPRSHTGNKKSPKIFSAKRPQNGDDLKPEGTISDKTAAEWRRHHARSPQPGNKNGGGRVAGSGRSLPTHNRTGGRDYIYKGTVWKMMIRRRSSSSRRRRRRRRNKKRIRRVAASWRRGRRRGKG